MRCAVTVDADVEPGGSCRGAALNKTRPLIPRRDHGPQILMCVERGERSVNVYRDVSR